MRKKRKTDVTFNIRSARWTDHRLILEIARTHSYTRDFGSNRYSSPEAYAKGWVVVAEVVGDPTYKNVLAGFACVRHKVRAPETVVYFLAVDRVFIRRGVGSMLLDHVIRTSPHDHFALNCALKNRDAIAFYKRCGFVIAGDALGGAGFRLTKEREHDHQPQRHQRVR